MIFRTLTVLSVVGVFGLCATEKLDLPVPTCKRDSLAYSSCLKDAINEAWPLFVKGLPSEFEFPPLDPFLYEYQKGVVGYGIAHGEVSVTNVTIEGIGAARFATVKSHFLNDVFSLKLNLYIPRIFCDGIVEANGNIGEFDMVAKGRANLILEDVKSTWTITGPVINNTWIINHVRIYPIPKNAKVQAIEIFEGNRELVELAEALTNKNWQPIYRVVLPIASEYWDTYFSNLLNRLFSKLSFSKVFP